MEIILGDIFGFEYIKIWEFNEDFFVCIVVFLYVFVGFLLYILKKVFGEGVIILRIFIVVLRFFIFVILLIIDLLVYKIFCYFYIDLVLLFCLFGIFFVMLVFFMWIFFNIVEVILVVLLF